MTIDLLHSGPLLLTAFLVVSVSLLACARWQTLAWAITGVGSVVHLAIAGMLLDQAILRGLTWNVLQTIVLISVPIAVGSRRIFALTARGVKVPLAYASGLLLGIGLGWVVLPIVLVAVGFLTTALNT